MNVDAFDDDAGDVAVGAGAGRVARRPVFRTVPNDDQDHTASLYAQADSVKEKAVDESSGEGSTSRGGQEHVWARRSWRVGGPGLEPPSASEAAKLRLPDYERGHPSRHRILCVEISKENGAFGAHDLTAEEVESIEAVAAQRRLTAGDDNNRDNATRERLPRRRMIQVRDTDGYVREASDRERALVLGRMEGTKEWQHPSPKPIGL